mmetsp:Transcript_69204/g.122660  ORF Transcript_69204/g.122660 Transcript_69204/m.122660 type:complete len:256 (+) Transcript_69204:87-854(+)
MGNGASSGKVVTNVQAPESTGDTAVADKATPASKRDQVKAVFEAWDTNDDGTISQDELKIALSMMGVKDDDVAVAFKAADANHDKIIDYEEFISWVYEDHHEAIQKMVAGAKGIKKEATVEALEAAAHVVAAIRIKDIRELKALAKPPKGVGECLGAIPVLFRQKTDWRSIQGMISNPSKFMERVTKFDKDSITPDMLKDVKKFTDQKDFTPASMKKASVACEGLCMWVLALQAYAEEPSCAQAYVKAVETSGEQ